MDCSNNLKLSEHTSFRTLKGVRMHQTLRFGRRGERKCRILKLEFPGVRWIRCWSESRSGHAMHCVHLSRVYTHHRLVAHSRNGNPILKPNCHTAITFLLKFHQQVLVDWLQYIRIHMHVCVCVFVQNIEPSCSLLFNRTRGSVKVVANHLGVVGSERKMYIYIYILYNARRVTCYPLELSNK